MKFSEFRKKPPPPGHVYMFVCEDDLLVDESRPVWSASFGGEWGWEKLPLKEFDAIGAGDLMEQARTPPLFGPSRALMVTGAGKLSKKRSAELAPLNALAQSSLKIVLVSSSRPRGPRPPFPVVQIDPVAPGETVRWAADRFGLPGDVARYLVDSLGTDLLTLKQEIEKLGTYTAESRPVEAADVDLLVFRSERYGPFELDDAFLARDYPRSVRILGSMLEEGVEPVLILGKLARVWRQVFIAKAMVPAATPAKAAEAAGVPHWKADRFASACRRFDRRAVAAGFRELVRADLALKTSSTRPEYGFDVLLWKLIGSGATPPRPG